MSVRICVLGSGSRGNSTWVRTEKTRLLVDAGFGRKAAAARLSVADERLDGCDAILVSHEHQDHISGLRSLALRLKVPIYISAATRDAIRWDPRITAFEAFTAGETFTIGDVEIHPFSVPHDAADPVAFTFEAEGIRVGVVTDLGYIPEVVKQRVRGCHCLVFESNHDLDMLKVGPYPWFVKQRVMSRHGHLSNYATAAFLGEDYDGAAQVLVLAHLSETNNHPEIVRLSATEALTRRAAGAFEFDIRRDVGPQGQANLRAKGYRSELYLAGQDVPTPLFQF
ncbi:MAG: MBL fold metallo-hydrolase [Acidobacteria bacterium]|nr:MAG: MBL fold metallo-hydrolase [Acidobacteriota bacterium]